MAEFIKSGKNIFKKPIGLDYDLIPGKVYTLSTDDWGNDEFKENGLLNMPSKVYKSERDVAFVKTVMDAYTKTGNSTTGVLLCGEKGTGKTMMSKILALESGLPIVIIEEDYPSQNLVRFFKEFETEVCILMDEVEKNHSTRRMLGFLDGVHKTSRKLVLMTCNNIGDVSEYFVDRASRVRYLRDYSMSENLVYIDDLLKDLVTTDENKVVIKDYISIKIKHPSIDNMHTLIQEIFVQGLADSVLTEEILDLVVKDLNIS